MFSVAVSTALPLTGVAPSSGRSPASSEAKHASSDCCTAVLPPRFHFCGLGSRGSRSSTPRVARNRTLRHRHTMHAKQSTASTAKVTATPTNAGLGVGLGSRPVSDDSAAADVSGTGCEGDGGAGGSAARGDGDGSGGGLGARRFSQPGHSQFSSSTQVQESPVQRSGLHMENCLPTRLWQPFFDPQQAYGGCRQGW